MTDPSQLANLLGEALGLVSGQTPFPWQTRLLGRCLEGEVPRALDIPTGLGKTATIAIWLLARAAGAAVPRRLVYVVDRRAVVDQATEEVVRLREWVERVPEIKRGLGLEGRRLPISTLRGQFVDNREWLEDPAGVAVVVGTVDMVGSRLLFQGYGVSRRMRPFHAGLLGSDSLFVLDEAHLVPPFERLLERIACDGAGLGPRTDAGLAQPASPRLLSLSATGRSRGSDSFDLDVADLDHDVVRRRLSATKRVTLHDLEPGADLAEVAAQRAWSLAGEGALPVRCIVFTTRRDDAEKVMAHVARLAGAEGKPKKGEEPVADLELLVGARRVFERSEAATRLRSLGFLAGSETARFRPSFLFATSAGEVGVDLDADHMVCDLVPWERMVQRLGRVNRRGEGDASVEVLVEAPADKAPPAAVEQRAAVLGLVGRLPLLEDGTRDASPGALRGLQRAARHDEELALQVEQATTPEPVHPALDRPTVDAWSMTSLKQHPGRPAVAPWLRGWIDDYPQTTLVWRTHLPRPDQAVRFFAAAPPHTSERLETESLRVADWLGRRAHRLVTRAGKVASEEKGLSRGNLVAFAYRPGEDEARPVTLDLLHDTPKADLVRRHLSGVTLVLDARFAGIAHGLLDHTEDSPPETLDGSAWLERNEDSRTPAIPFRVRATGAQEAIIDRHWRERERLPLDLGLDGEVTRWLVVDKWRHDSATEEDRSAGRPQRLADHLAWTVERARSLAGKLGLGPAAEEVLAIAARLHDEGKGARRWQAAVHAASDDVYAKTRGPVDVHLLDGYRHEFGSLGIAEGDPELVRLPEDQRELVLHLVASHHGSGRPLIGTRGCQDAPPSALEQRARQVALRFGRLQQRWGPWGLAWWEVLLRSSDQWASRDNDIADAAPAGEET